MNPTAKNHIVIIGGGYDNGEAALYGTGLSYGEVYVVTCRHVTDGAEGDNLFAISNLKQTLDPKPYGYPCILLGPPHYHPDDTNEQTYDIAIAKLIDTDGAELEARQIIPVQLNEVTIGALYEEQRYYTAKGYPFEYAEHAFKRKVEDPLWPKEIHGRARQVPVEEIPIKENGDALFGGCHFIEADITFESGKGMSGGLVYASHSDEIAGMLIAGGAIDPQEGLYGFMPASIILDYCNGYNG